MLVSIQHQQSCGGFMVLADVHLDIVGLDVLLLRLGVHWK
jgi:hypothetical protein